MLAEKDIDVLRSVFPELKCKRRSKFPYKIPVQLNTENPIKFVLSGATTFEASIIDGYTFHFTLPLVDEKSFGLSSKWIDPNVLLEIAEVTFGELKNLQDDGEDELSTALMICNRVVLDLPVDFEVKLVNHYRIETTKPQTFEKWRSIVDNGRIRRFNDRSFLFPVCLESVSGIDGVLLDCDHSICKACLREFTTESMDHGDCTKLQCPECPIDVLPNTQDLTKAEYRAFLFKERMPLSALRQALDEAVVQRFHRLTKNLSQFRYTARFPRGASRSPKCDALVFHDDLADTKLECDSCSYAFCFECDKEWHGYKIGCNGHPSRIPGDALKEIMSGDAPMERKQHIFSLWGEDKLLRRVEFVNEMIRQRERERVQRLRERQEQERALLERARLEQARFERAYPVPELPKKDYHHVIPCLGCSVSCVEVSGCNALMCSLCHIRFCYVCGKTPPNGISVHAHIAQEGPCQDPYVAGLRNW